MLEQSERRWYYVEIKEFEGSLDALNKLLGGNEWDILAVFQGTRTTYILGRRSSFEFAAGEMLLEMKSIGDEKTANEMLISGKWRLLDARIAQHASTSNGNVATSASTLFLFGRTKL